ncbi:ribose 5-phosphate isomerase B [Campylobacter sp. 19-13652]|uniref:ribose 5-phosphate isomerase B n=1 Tax=Campylobacter sp. 19-13652 TaxID=2840180 RepID=UPI001C78DD79|nr:ribose 5-phosphate isomerase B [Campylobacter sp. 19-13652]BCX79103.1 ribose 5-phosphate isomerase B [Campylobacter sp. 19-13652]
MKIHIASDHAGFCLKETLKHFLIERGHQINDLGTHSKDSVDYPDYAHALAKALNDGEFGVLICGSGIGISIAANRHENVRCALAHDSLSARLARMHNNANVIAFGERLIGTDVAKDALLAFLETKFEGGRHEGRVEKINKGR